jgi:hypothetical protein
VDDDADVVVEFAHRQPQVDAVHLGGAQREVEQCRIGPLDELRIECLVSDPGREDQIDLRRLIEHRRHDPPERGVVLDVDEPCRAHGSAWHSGRRLGW